MDDATRDRVNAILDKSGPDDTVAVQLFREGMGFSEVHCTRPADLFRAARTLVDQAQELLLEGLSDRAIPYDPRLVKLSALLEAAFRLALDDEEDE